MANSADYSSGSSMLAKVPVKGFPNISASPFHHVIGCITGGGREVIGYAISTKVLEAGLTL